MDIEKDLIPCPKAQITNYETWVTFRTVPLKFAHPPFLRLPIVIRTMSTTTLHSFMVYAPDYADAVDRRQKVREQHLIGLKEVYDSGALREYHCHQLCILRIEDLKKIRWCRSSRIWWCTPHSRFH